MAERLNGKSPFSKRTHGSERRGVFPVPALGYAYRQEQSKADKARLIEIIKQRNEVLIATPESDLGNKELPAYRHKQEIVANIEAHKAVILGGATGSGKSTQLPQYLYEAGYDMTVVLVPRRIIADGLGERIRDEMASQIEGFDPLETVGIVHGERNERHENNKIMVMTPNTFMRMETQFRSQLGDKRVAIISDEIHEANLFTEIATGVAALAVKDNKDWRLIAASATHNADTLEASFEKLNEGGYVPSIHIEGRPFQIEQHEDPQHNSMEVYAIHSKDHEKSMIFTSGKKEIDHIIEETASELDRREAGSSKQVVFRKLHGELSSFELSHVNDPIPDGYRLVIVSSPAGMSGITISGVTLVVTDGTINREELDDYGIEGMLRYPLSKAEITQQMGRAGRDVPGGVGILAMPTTVADDVMRKRGKEVEVPQMEFLSFDERAEHAPPEIYSSNLSRVVLTVAGIDRRFSELNPYIPHPVEASPIINAEESLSRLGALNDEDKITKAGRAMDRLPISPELSRGMYELSRHEKTPHARPLQQLARAAFIAAAIDSGGLQDFSDKQKYEWRQLIRPTTGDDFIAQLDIMTALSDHTRAGLPTHEFIESYTLNPKHIENAQKAARKILKIAFNVDVSNLIIMPPQPDEETQLRNDLSAGMIDLVYEEAGMSYKKKVYRNIHGDETSTKRELSDRSVIKPEQGQLVAGLPRWFETKNKHGDPVRHNVVEMTLLVDPVVIGKHAEKNKLLRGNLVAPRIDGDLVVEREQMMFGTIKVGEPVNTVWREEMPATTQQLLVQQSLQVPRQAQLALRKIADELEYYRERVPEKELNEYKKTNAPIEITKDYITNLIREYARYTRSQVEIDQQLSQYSYSKNVTINRYFSDDARQELLMRSPSTVSVVGSEVSVLYDKGSPYITKVTREQRKAIKAPLLLEDGREILLQIPVKGGGTRRVSLGALEVE